MFKEFKPEMKLFLFVGLIAVVVSVGGILLLKTMQPSPIVQTPPPQPQAPDTSDFTLREIEGWQTYRSDEFGFEFRAPSTMKLEFQESEGFILSFERRGDGDSIGGHIEVRARILNAVEIQETKKYLEDARAANPGSEVPEGSRVIKVANTNLGNCVGVQTQFTNAYLVSGCLKGNLSLSVILVVDLEAAEEYKILYNQILATFRFVE